ncbi:MAG TPA: glycerol-3-phosphate 1-O-acyltransferase PlsY [Phycisphaerae bacterium]|nr:glycerol-3-phosphate 1-O-acyltransferase PlsY [Phycisphaerae bacterium]
MMTEQQIVLTIFVTAPITYLIGSIPFGLILGLARGVDIRKHGSGNIGATNAGRVLGMRYFWYAFFLDFLKGFLPVLVCDLLITNLNGPIWIPLITAAAAISGHLFPIYLGFKGGKGVATSFGAMLGIWPVFTLSALGAVGVFAVVFMSKRIISISSMVAAISFAVLVPLVGHFLSPIPGVIQPESWHELMPLLIASWLLCAMVIWKHRSNIRRLLTGTEPKMGESASTAPIKNDEPQTK